MLTAVLGMKNERKLFVHCFAKANRFVNRCSVPLPVTAVHAALGAIFIQQAVVTTVLSEPNLGRKIIYATDYIIFLKKNLF